MTGSTALARVAIAAPFVVGGWQAATRPDGLASKATVLPHGVARALVVANGCALAAGGIALASGRARPLTGRLLAACLLPSTVLAHPFWRPEVDRRAELLQLTKDLAMAGGVVLASAALRDGDRE